MRKYKYVYEFNCTWCDIKHPVVVGNLSSAVKNKKTNFCSKECRKKWFETQRKKQIKKNCLKCNSEFITYECKNHKFFCSRRCYEQDMTDNPNKYNLDKKAEKARESYTKFSSEKMVQTKIERGLTIDWKDATWKQFWRKCDYLVHKLRPKLLESWNGIDYLDSEDIKVYLSLPPFHKNYPCLDHIKPKQICYKEGMTPEQACETSNLAWTKRTNNSKKYTNYKRGV